MHYSPSVGCFYPENLTYPDRPTDLIDVTDEQYAAAMARGPRDALVVQDGELVVVAYVTTLADAQAEKISELNGAYQAVINAPIRFTTAAGSNASFARSVQAKAQLADALSANAKTQMWPIGLWLDVNGMPVSPFTYADLQGLADAMAAADTPAYQELLTLISEVHTATTVQAAQSVTWA